MLRAPVRAGADGTASTQLDTRMIVRRGGGVEGDEEIASRYFENARRDGVVPLAVGGGMDGAGDDRHHCYEHLDGGRGIGAARDVEARVGGGDII